MDESLKQKYNRLITDISNKARLIIAFSGGVDSTLLVHLASKTIGSNTIAVTLNSEFYPIWELEYASKTAAQLNIEHHILMSSPLANPEIAENQPDRCYKCKKQLFTELREFADNRGLEYICDGSCLDDLGDYRPGFKAIKELKIYSPFIEHEFTKQDIITLSQELNIPGWDRPSGACLASRIPYYQNINTHKLEFIAQSEVFLHKFGLAEARVRLHGDIARIEVFPENIQKLINNREAVSEKLKELGANYVTVELSGYKTGSLNAQIQTER